MNLNFLDLPYVQTKRVKKSGSTGIKAKKKRKIKAEAKKRIKELRASPTAQNALLFNSFVLGIHNYFNRATHVNLEFSRLAYDLSAFMYNRLKQIGKYEHPNESTANLQEIL